MISQAKIPSFKTLEEEAMFWDTHDTTEFEAEFEPIEVTFVKPLIRRELIVSLDEQMTKRLRRLAEEKKVEPDNLVRLWIAEHLQAEMAQTV